MILEGGKIKNKTVWVSLIILVLASVAMTRIGVASPAEVKMTIDPTPVTAKGGTTITVAIKVVGAPDGAWGVYSWQARLEWKSSNLTYVSAEEGPFLREWAAAHSTETYGITPILGTCTDHPAYGTLNYVILSWSLVAGGSLTYGRGGSGHLAYVKFTVPATPQDKSILLFHNPGAAAGADTAMLNYMAHYIGEAGSGNTFTAVNGQYVVGKTEDVVWDGDIDILDLTTVAINYLKTGSPGWIPADVNKDGKINIADLAMVAYAYGWYAGTKPIDC